ncbi:hypothetical protein B0A48_15341 [Cryoendolithus antarcticus]|uniref:Uncharacterized protein n=1 Tax=Cryoendolithus antarcticus TaxID=1507870 RepID=A0A1V8SHP8_9PEZI|nr:hypothetical protein B0A48_15341 [Cryoendolithus antarcticus]
MSSNTSFDPYIIGELVTSEVKWAMHSLKLAPNNTRTPDEISKQVGKKIINHLVKQKTGALPDARVAYYAAARRFFRERFNIDNAEALLDALFGFCVQVETVSNEQWEGSDGSQNAGNLSLPVGLTKERLDVLSQQLAEGKEQIAKAAAECAVPAAPAKEVYGGMDVTALREQILTNVRRLTRIRSAHPTPEMELIIDRDGTWYLAAVVALTHTGEDDGSCRIKETVVSHGIAAETVIDAMHSLFETSMMALEKARADLLGREGLTDRAKGIC